MCSLCVCVSVSLPQCCLWRMSPRKAQPFLKLQYIFFNFFQVKRCSGGLRVHLHLHVLPVMRSLPSFQPKKGFCVCGCHGGSITTNHAPCLICTNWSWKGFSSFFCRGWKSTRVSLCRRKQTNSHNLQSIVVRKKKTHFSQQYFVCVSSNCVILTFSPRSKWCWCGKAPVHRQFWCSNTPNEF